MASPGTSIIQGKYISAWGGIQSAGQTIGQIVSILQACHLATGELICIDAPIRDGKIWPKGRALYHMA